MSKGQRTESSILSEALRLASLVGLEGLTVGALAKNLGISKSGLFAHFASKEVLQQKTLKLAHARFEEQVIQPALKVDPGIPRIRTLFLAWLQWLTGSPSSPGGCLLLTASIEYDDRPGPLQDLVQAGQRDLRGAVAKMVRQCITLNQLPAQTDPWQLTFEIFAILLAAHHELRLLNDTRAQFRALTAFERVLRSQHL